MEVVSMICAGRLKKLSIGQNIQGYGGVDKYLGRWRHEVHTELLEGNFNFAS
jgi:hypothetical protein